MEATTPFDLNQAIERWRESLRQNPAFQQENLEELESHLRDSVANLKERGLSDDEAFLVATKRAGGSGALGTEFGKINCNSIWLNRVLWMLIGTQIFGLIRSSTFTFSYLTGALTARQMDALERVMTADGTEHASWLAGLLCGFTQLLTYAFALTIGWRVLVRKGNAIAFWWQKKSSRHIQLIVFVALWIVLPFMPLVVDICTRPLLAKFFQTYHGSQFFVALNYGQGLASVVETITLITLTLLLARRQMLAKT